MAHVNIDKLTDKIINYTKFHYLTILLSLHNFTKTTMT